MNRLGLFALGFAACHSSPRPAPPGAAVTGQVTAAPGTTATGKLIVSWMTPEENHTIETSPQPILVLRNVISRGTVIGEVDLARPAAFTVNPGRGRFILSATLDAGHVGITSMFGDPGALSGISAPIDVADAPVAVPPIALAGGPSKPHVEGCQGPELTLEHLEAPGVAGTVGNSTSRRVCVRVPKDYADHPDKHYPVIYALPGLAGNDEGAAAHHLADSEAAITVIIDTSTTTGSTYFVDNPTVGAWDTFFAKDVIPYIDAHYRTLARRAGRGLVGHSTGGFNAMSYGLRHPELFGAIGSSSPDGLDFQVWLRDLHAARPWMQGWQRLEHELGGAGQFTSYAADWSPTPGGYDWLFDASGAVVERVLQRWLVNIPSTWLADPKRVAAVMPLGGHIYLTVGDTDEFDLHDPTVKFSEELTAVGIANELVVTHGGHATHLFDQVSAAVKFCVAKLDPAQ